MASAKEIKNKVQSIQSTQKITRAMEMVAASKMKKAQHRMQASRPYLQRIKDVIAHLEHGNLEEKHSYLIERPLKNVGFLVVSTDRGLCGGLNTNIFRAVFRQMEELEKQGISSVVCTIGSKAERFFSYNGAKVLASTVDLGDKPAAKDLIGVTKVLLDEFKNNGIDKIFLAYNRFGSTIKQEPQIEVLLPAVDEEYVPPTIRWDYIYEPSPMVLLDTLLHRYIETLIFQAVVENVACEQSARMVAMRSASDNAQDLIDELNLIYNKARQAGITTELAEISAGAAAV